MKQFNKVLVGLDLSEMDNILIEKTSKLVTALGIDKIYFVHVEKDLSLPDDIAKAYPDLLAPVDEAIKKNIHTKVKEWVPESVEVDISVKEGNPMETILRWAKIKNIDLLIMGRKIELDGQGTLAKNLAQKAPCSVLFLTEDLKIRDLEHILVPMDFSEHSYLTLKFVERLSHNFNAKISCIHIYEVPTGYPVFISMRFLQGIIRLVNHILNLPRSWRKMRGRNMRRLFKSINFPITTVSLS